MWKVLSLFSFMSLSIPDPNLIFRFLLFSYIREELRVLYLKSRRIELITEMGAVAEQLVCFTEIKTIYKTTEK
jgi:hypothetical protein